MKNCKIVLNKAGVDAGLLAYLYPSIENWTFQLDTSRPEFPNVEEYDDSVSGGQQPQPNDQVIPEDDDSESDNESEEYVEDWIPEF